MNRLSLRNGRLKLERSGELPISLEESIEYTSNEYSKTGRCQHVTGWIWNHKDLDRLPMPKNFLGKWITCNGLRFVPMGAHGHKMSGSDLHAWFGYFNLKRTPIFEGWVDLWTIYKDHTIILHDHVIGFNIFHTKVGERRRSQCCDNMNMA